MRKGTKIPYLSHLLQVAGLVLEDGGDEDEAIAGLLHDVIEDRSVEPAGLAARFGRRVADIVVGCSDSGPGDDARPQGKDPWPQRKMRYIEHLRSAPPSVIRVSLADKLHNARSILFDYRAHGEELWARFDPDSDQIWYYRALCAVYLERTESPFADELARVIDALEELASPATQ